MDVIRGFFHSMDFWAPAASSSLSYQGKNTIPSVMGGICSVLSATFVIWMFITQCVNMSSDEIFRQNSSVVAMSSFEAPVTVPTDIMIIAVQLDQPVDVAIPVFW